MLGEAPFYLERISKYKVSLKPLNVQGVFYVRKSRYYKELKKVILAKGKLNKLITKNMINN